MAEVREPRRREPGLALAELVLEGRDEAQGLEPVQVRRVLQQEQLPLRATPQGKLLRKRKLQYDVVTSVLGSFRLFFPRTGARR